MTWKNNPRFTRWPYRDHSQATEAADKVPIAAPATMLAEFDFEQQRAHEQRRLHALAGDHQRREPEHTDERGATLLHRFDLCRWPSISSLDSAGGAPHVDRERGHRNGRGNRQHTLPEGLIRGASQQHRREDADANCQRNAPVDGRNQFASGPILRR